MYNVYKLIKEGELVYIGKSTHLEARIRSHVEKKSFDAVEYCELETKELMDRVEALLIYKLLPPLNKRFEYYGYVREGINNIGSLELSWINFEGVCELNSVKKKPRKVSRVKTKVTKLSPKEVSYKLFENVDYKTETLMVKCKKEVGYVSVDKVLYKYSGTTNFGNFKGTISDTYSKVEVNGFRCSPCYTFEDWDVLINGITYSIS